MGYLDLLYFKNTSLVSLLNLDNAAVFQCQDTVSAVKDGDGVGTINAGDRFEVLEITAAHAWGVAADGTVGFVPLASLGRP